MEVNLLVVLTHLHYRCRWCAKSFRKLYRRSCCADFTLCSWFLLLAFCFAASLSFELKSPMTHCSGWWVVLWLHVIILCYYSMLLPNWLGLLIQCSGSYWFHCVPHANLLQVESWEVSNFGWSTADIVVSDSYHIVVIGLSLTWLLLVRGSSLFMWMLARLLEIDSKKKVLAVCWGIQLDSGFFVSNSAISVWQNLCMDVSWLDTSAAAAASHYMYSPIVKVLSVQCLQYLDWRITLQMLVHDCQYLSQSWLAH